MQPVWRSTPVLGRLLPLTLVLLLAGCVAQAPLDAQDVPTSTTTPAPVTRMTIEGVVVDAAIQPLAGATVTILELNATQLTGPTGTFRFEDLPVRSYFLTANAPEHMAKTLSVDSSGATLRFQLDAMPTERAFNVTIPFKGHIQCALEVIIISPSCDSLITYVGQDPVFEQDFTANLPVGRNWKTVVGDLQFDASAYPLLDGLRVVARGTLNQSDTGTYEQYGRFFGSEPFTFRLEPNGTYPEGVTPVPAQASLFQFDTYPHSHGWHALCAPPGSETCFLGAGAGLDISFDLFLTVFYVEAAPEGWSFRGE